MEGAKDGKEGKEKKKPVFAKTTYDVQRIRLEKMMQNPVSFSNLELSFHFYYVLIM